MVAVEVDGDVLEGFKGADDAFDADPGGLLEVAGYGQGGHDHWTARCSPVHAAGPGVPFGGAASGGSAGHAD